MRRIVILICASVLAACSGGGGSSDESTGSISVSLMDRPVDGVTSLFVTITEVWIKPSGTGPAFELPMTSTPLTVDLLSLGDQNASVLVDEAVIPADSYNWMELVIDDSTIDRSYAMTTTGGMEPVDVDVPSGKIRLVSGFDVTANQGLRVLFDWDVRKGLTEAVGRGTLLLRPAFRVLDVDELGAISGSVLDTTIQLEATCGAIVPDNSEPVVYVFEGDVTPDEIDGADPDPITTIDANFNPGTSDYDYRVVVMPGDYTVAATCEGDLDADDTTDGISFIPAAGVQVTVTAGTPVVDVDF